jgi:uncharacterized protein DUF6714
LVWTDVPERVLDETADRIALLSPDAFRYYLPAFLMRSIADPEKPGGTSVVLDFTVQSLCDDHLPTDHWWAERIPPLTAAQHRAAATFLEWVRDLLAGDEDEEFLRRTVQNATEKYWSTAGTARS